MDSKCWPLFGPGHPSLCRLHTSYIALFLLRPVVPKNRKIILKYDKKVVK